MKWSLFPLVSSVSVCDLGTLVVESRLKMEPTGLSVWPDICPHFLHLPGQRGRQSGASGVFWGLGLTQSSLQKQIPIIWSDLYSFWLDNSAHISRFRSQLVIPQNKFLAACCLHSVWESIYLFLQVWICQTPAVYIEIWIAHFQEQVIFSLAGSSYTLHLYKQNRTVATHLKLGDEFCKNAEKGLCVGGLAVLSKVGGHLRKLLHRSGLQRLQRLDRRVAVLQKAL